MGHNTAPHTGYTQYIPIARPCPASNETLMTLFTFDSNDLVITTQSNETTLASFETMHIMRLVIAYSDQFCILWYKALIFCICEIHFRSSVKVNLRWHLNASKVKLSCMCFWNGASDRQVSGAGCWFGQEGHHCCFHPHWEWGIVELLAATIAVPYNLLLIHQISLGTSWTGAMQPDHWW